MRLNALCVAHVSEQSFLHFLYYRMYLQSLFSAAVEKLEFPAFRDQVSLGASIQLVRGSIVAKSELEVKGRPRSRWHSTF